MYLIFLSILPIFWCIKTEASVLVADNGMSKMIELNANAPFCTLYHDRGVIQRMILGADPKKVRQMSNNLVDDLEETCKKSRSKGKNQPAGGGLIYPGTKWCGPGSLAESYDDLGHHSAEDACCREHDHCPVTINPKECINGICNNSPFTRSHCDCDAKFRRCLQNLNTEVANTLGALFFNVIQVTCFKERRPCSKWQSIYGLEWQRSPRYFSNDQRAWRQKAQPVLKTIINFLTEIISKTFVHHRQQVGYDEEDADLLCSQYKFQPSDKYVPLMPLNMNM